jgi:hypothetical protein
MSFLQDAESSLAPSITQESTTTSQADKNGKKSSPVWAHTRQPLEGEDPSLLYCSYCELTDDLAPYDANTSSAIIKHINRKHSHVVIKKSISKNQQIVHY